MWASCDNHETFTQVSHDVRANFNQFYFLTTKSQNGLIYVAFVSHICHIVKMAEKNCDVSAYSGKG